MKRIFCLLSVLPIVLTGIAQDRNGKGGIPEKSEILVADTTCLFVRRDTCDLYLDIYYPAEGSETSFDGIEKPTVLYVFGGGFVSGERDAVLQLRWYRKLVEEGFRVVAIDYRLGLKPILKQKRVSKLKIAKGIETSLQIALEDLYAATDYLIAHGKALGIDPYNMVVSGSSAGAMTVLQADYQLCNRTRFDVPLPAGFRYRGILSFSGGVYSREGRPDYEETPAPTLLMHGTDDRIVNYRQIRFFNIGFFGSDRLMPRLKKYGANCSIYRYLGNGHEIAASFTPLIDDELAFIYTNVMQGKKKIVDAVLSDPRVDTRFQVKHYRDLYHRKK